MFSVWCTNANGQRTGYPLAVALFLDAIRCLPRGIRGTGSSPVSIDEPLQPAWNLTGCAVALRFPLLSKRLDGLCDRLLPLTCVWMGGWVFGDRSREGQHARRARANRTRARLRVWTWSYGQKHAALACKPLELPLCCSPLLTPAKPRALALPGRSPIVPRRPLWCLPSGREHREAVSATPKVPRAWIVSVDRPCIRAGERLDKPDDLRGARCASHGRYGHVETFREALLGRVTVGVHRVGVTGKLRDQTTHVRARDAPALARALQRGRLAVAQLFPRAREDAEAFSDTRDTRGS